MPQAVLIPDFAGRYRSSDIHARCRQPRLIFPLLIPPQDDLLIIKVASYQRALSLDFILILLFTIN